MKYNPITRRHFLVGTGGYLLSVPLLTSLLPGKAQAATTAGKRFFCLGYDNGRHLPSWHPSTAEMAKLQAVNGIQYMREMALSGIAGNISQVFQAPFNGAIREKMLFIKGLDGLWVNTQGHQTSTILAGNLGAGQASGTADRWEPKFGPSADYIIAKNIKSNPNAARASSYVNVGITDSWEMSFRYDAAANRQINVGREMNPLNTFNTLFGNITQAPAVSDRNTKVVDLVLENFNSVISSNKLAREEKLLLQEHIQSLSELQTNLRASDPVTSQECVRPTAPANGKARYDNGADLERINNLHVDIMVAAAKCGIVNVGTLLLARAVDDTIFSNLGITGNWHGVYSHNTMNSPEVLAITRLMAGFYGRFINGLNVPEPGTNGTYLDNSLVLFGNAMGDGTAHSYSDLGVSLAGSLGGRLRTGRFIDYSNQGQGRNYCAFLAMILTAMGLSPEDYQQSNVAAGFGSDTIQGNPPAWARDRGVLPGILA